MSNDQISHLLEHYILGEPYSIRRGTVSYPATEKDTSERYIAKEIGRAHV